MKLQDYKYVPDLHIHLFSLTKATDQGYKLTNGNGSKRNHLILFHPKTKEVIRFDKEHRSENGIVVGLKAVSSKPVSNYCNPAILEAKTVHTYNDFHKLIGHPSYDTTKKTAESLNIYLSGKPEA